jgi:hypothetical protein
MAGVERVGGSGAGSRRGAPAVTVSSEDSWWVPPDYASIPADADLPGDETERRWVWPGPAMVMPAGLLPDGKPHSCDDRDNAERISGVRPRTMAEADACVLAYWRQQATLRAAAGLPPARRDTSSGHWVEAPETVAAIRELHRQEHERRRMQTPPEVGEFLHRLTATVVDAGEAMLREHGLCPPPTVHMVCADLDPPYAGMLGCRPFYRGGDAADAVAAMGALPAQVGATHLLVVWEHADLCTALQLPGECADGTFPSGLVVLVATMSEHTVHRYPFDIRLGAPSPAGLPTVLPRWGTSTCERGGWVPDPLHRLLARWRQHNETDLLRHTATRLQGAGYRIRWAARS